MDRNEPFLFAFVGLAWLGNGLYAFGWDMPAVKFWSPSLVAFGMIGFLLLHGTRAEGRLAIVRFAVLACVVGWLFEAVSLGTGFPFGSYHYTDIMAPMVGGVSAFVLPAYCVMGYVCWRMARILVDRTRGPADRQLTVVAPVVAALLMVLWDVSMDPLRSTLEGRWIWHHGGPHFGTPLSNFSGWFVVSWTIFQAYALTLPQAARVHSALPAEGAGRSEAAVPLMYLAFPVEYLGNPLLADPGPATVSVEGVPVLVSDLHASVAVLTLVTMVPIAILAFARVFAMRGLVGRLPIARPAPLTTKVISK